MAVIFMEGFDYLTAGNMTLYGWGLANGSMQSGRLGGQAYRSTNNQGTNVKNFLGGTAGSTTTYSGFAFRFNSNTSVAGSVIYGLRSSGTDVLRLNQTSSNNLQILNSAGTAIATTQVFTLNIWYYIEIKLFVNGASGTVETRVNGVTDVASTVGNFGSASINSISIGTTNGSSANTDFDDMYVVDTTGSSHNTWLGEQRVEVILPNGAGNSSQWTASTGNAFQTIDDSQGNGDTDYIYSSTVNDVSTFTYGDLSVSAGSVNAVQVNHLVRKDDVATRQIATVVRTGGTDYVGSTEAALSTNYLGRQELYDQDPTGSDWTISSVNAAEFGVKLIQ